MDWLEVLLAGSSSDIWNIVSSISTFAGVLVALGLAIVPAIFSKFKLRKSGRKLALALVAESMVLLRNYYNYCPQKHRGNDSIKYWTDTDVETLIDIRTNLERLEELSGNLSKTEADLLVDFTFAARNIFSGWAVKKSKWIETYSLGRKFIQQLSAKKIWNIEFHEEIDYSKAIAEKGQDS